MDNLKELRNRIDEIDTKLVALFEERMEIVMKVAEYKKLNNIPILDEGREEEVIKKNRDKLNNKNLEASLDAFFRHLMKLSKEEQEKIYE